jgi:hypothetical protein
LIAVISPATIWLTLNEDGFALDLPDLGINHGGHQSALLVALENVI